MTVDCFPFFNELDILEIRMRELWDEVDLFLTVESSKTHSMRDKPFYLESNRSRLEKYSEKLRIIKTKDFDQIWNGSAWSVENYQRNLLSVLVAEYCKNDDFCMLSDLDEIPSRESVRWLKTVDIKNLVSISVGMSFHAYFLNAYSPGKGWKGTVFTTVGNFLKKTPQKIRDSKDRIACLAGGGWHLSWMGGVDGAYEKMISFAHQENPLAHVSKAEFSEVFRKAVIENRDFSLDGSEKVPLVPFPMKELPSSSADFPHLMFNFS